jgi:hypothetical protein
MTGAAPTTSHLILGGQREALAYVTALLAELQLMKSEADSLVPHHSAATIAWWRLEDAVGSVEVICARGGNAPPTSSEPRLLALVRYFELLDEMRGIPAITQQIDGSLRLVKISVTAVAPRRANWSRAECREIPHAEVQRILRILILWLIEQLRASQDTRREYESVLFEYLGKSSSARNEDFQQIHELFGLVDGKCRVGSHGKLRPVERVSKELQIPKGALQGILKKWELDGVVETTGTTRSRRYRLSEAGRSRVRVEGQRRELREAASRGQVSAAVAESRVHVKGPGVRLGFETSVRQGRAAPRSRS